MLTVGRALAVAVVAAVAIIVSSGTALAGDGWGGTECGPGDRRPGCDVSAGSNGNTSGPQGSASDGSGGGSGGGDGCVYRQVYPSAATAAALGQPQGEGGWYMKSCLVGDGEMAFDGPIWIAGGPPTVSPEVLAREARSRLDLPAVAIRLSPAGDQLVNLPTWLAMDPASWQAQSATASVPGVSVTATARPSKATWVMGDGATVACNGPGTPWRPGMDPSAASPDCGHRYLRSSAGAPGAVFRVIVTVTWEVTWAGAGQSGTVPGLTTTGQVLARVQESQTVIS